MPSASSTAEPRPFERRAVEYGCTEIIRLDEKLSEPRQLDYLDLLPTRSNQRPPLTGVAEHQGTALLYLVDGCSDACVDAEALSAVRRRLANRSDPAWLGVVRSGTLEVFPIGFHESTGTQPVRTIEEGSATAPLFFQSLVHGTFEENNRLRGTDYVYRKIFELLTQTTNEFVPADGTGKMDALAVLSMAGRALFFRFLIDRRIVLDDELTGDDGICPAATELKDAFSSAQKAAQTSAWLDATFNGDFLPLIDESIPNNDRPAREAAYLEFFKATEKLVGSSIFLHLHAILRGWREVGRTFQMEIDWGDLDFAHIPVGVLSQVYESFSHRADPRTATDTSVHYTPRTIASLMVDEAFAAVKNPAEAKVLDSSCGAGIFLVLAFRRLVRERWQGNERPKTNVIQDVLYNQIRGFDISESALRLAALSLYITAIELNATQRPPHALKFPGNLRNTVLHRFGADEEDCDADVVPLGSLGPDVPPDFDGTFDIVIGNPPWTRLRDRTNDDDSTSNEQRKAAITRRNGEFTAIGRRVLGARNVDLPKQYENPDNNPDLPFLWRATEWSKPGGVIALAMPARLFGRTSGVGFEAWRAVLRGVEVTGLISGADLRWSAVWKDVKMPFCMFFARNAKSEDGHRFHFASPINEPDVNANGRFRIDYESAQPISVARVEQQPWLLKTLSFGTWLDVELMEPLANPDNKTLEDRWSEWDAKGDKTGKGFDRSPRQFQKFVDYLASLPVFERPKDGFEIDFPALKTYGEQFGTNANGQSSAYWPKTEELFTPPVVIVPQSPGKKEGAPRAYLSERPIAFSQSYYGYSCAGHADASTLAALLYLLPHSTLFAYFCLMTSRRSGFDRHTFNKEEFDALPFPDISKLSGAKRKSMRSLARRLQTDATKPWREINELIFDLYGLAVDDIQVAEDTLFFAATYRIAGQAAFKHTTRDTRADFVTSLSESLEPYFDICGERVAVREAEFQVDSWKEPWFFLSVSRESEIVKINPALMRKAMEAANKRGCSRIIVHAPKKSGLLLGLLNQRRWWTITRARLCAQHIIRERLGACGLPEDA
jgi:hypothetical protein